ncbi:MAG: acyltransferase family protein [Candidatus Binataceae bacterium]
MIARQHSYVPSLDGLRAVCIGAVVFFHVPMPAGHPWLQAVRSRCWYGVDMFFILSGFLITWILAVEFENTGKVDLAYFYRARSLRLLPAYFSAIVLVFGAAYLSGNHAEVKFFPPAKVWPLLLTYSLNLWIATTAIWPAGLSHFWSLCVEEHFYLSWSLVFRRWGISRALKIALAAIVVVAAYRSGLYLFMNWGHLASPSRASYYRIHYATDTRIDAILIGCALALLMREGRLERFWRFMRTMPLLPTLSLIAALACITWVTGYRWRQTTFGYTAMALASSMVLMSIFLRPECWIGRILATRPLVAIGQISYGVYLFHAPLLIAFEARLGAYATGLENDHYLLVLGALSLASVAVAAIHYRLVERRFLAMRKPRSYIAPRGERAAAAA